MLNELMSIFENAESEGNIVLEHIEKYSEFKQTHPHHDPHILIAKTFLSRRPLQTDQSERLLTEHYAFSSTVIPSCLTEGQNIELAAAIALKEERPGVIAKFPRFAARVEHLVKPLRDSINNGKRLSEIYEQMNGLMQINEHFEPVGFLIADNFYDEIATGSFENF